MTTADAVSIIGFTVPTQEAVGILSLLMSQVATTRVLTARLALVPAGVSAEASEAQLHTSTDASRALKRRALKDLLEDAVEVAMIALRAMGVPLRLRGARGRFWPRSTLASSAQGTGGP